MEFDNRAHGATWRWPLLLSVVFLNKCFISGSSASHFSIGNSPILECEAQELMDGTSTSYTFSYMQRHLYIIYVFFIDLSPEVCLPSLVYAYGVILVNLNELQIPLWLGLSTPTIYILVYNLSQCWCREIADSWGGSVGYRVMASVGLLMVMTSLIICAVIPIYYHPYAYGILGGFGSSLISAQVDAAVFDTYDSRLGVIRGLCFAGQAVGQSLFPHIITSLIDCYGYSNSYIVLAGIMLQTLPAIMLLRVEERLVRPISFSRYSDVAKTYAVFSNETIDYHATELPLHDMSKKCWKSPSDDNLHRDPDFTDCFEYDNDIVATVTPPPSPEEKRRNIFGVEILPEIPEESEESDNDDLPIAEMEINDNKKRLSVAIKRLSTLGDNLDEYISKQIRKDSQTSERDISNYKEYTEVEVIYDNVSPVTDIQREKIFNSFSFRCQSAYASMRRRMWMPSYKIYTMKRRFTYFIYYMNDTFVKPLTRSLSCWKFFPSLLLYFSKLSLTSVTMVSLPMIASGMHPKISVADSNFLMTLYGFSWICFLMSTPWLTQTPKRNFKYVAVFGLLLSTVACYVLAEADNHDSFSIGCVIAGFGYGAISCCWETAVQDFVGARKWPKLHSPLETISGLVLTAFVIGISFILDHKRGLQLAMFILAIILSIITFIWLIIALTYLYIHKIKNRRLGRQWTLQ